MHGLLHSPLFEGVELIETVHAPVASRLGQGIGMVEQTLQAVTGQPGGLHAGFAGTFVTTKQMHIVQATPVVGGFTALQHSSQLAHIGQSQVQSQTRQGMDGVRRIARQHPSAALCKAATPGVGLGQLQRPGLNYR